MNITYSPWTVHANYTKTRFTVLRNLYADQNFQQVECERTASGGFKNYGSEAEAQARADALNESPRQP